MKFAIAVLASLLANAIWIGAVGLVVARGAFRGASGVVLRMTTVSRRKTLRFSASVLLRVKEHDRYLLVVTPTRGDGIPFWGPLGGVIKYRSQAEPVLDDLEVQTHWSKDALDDMVHDLRVKMPGRSFWRFIRWYSRGDDRESVTETLRRELKEELNEVGVHALAERASELEFVVTRIGRTTVFKQDGMLHYRIFYICDPAGPLAADFVHDLSAASVPGILEFVSTSEIEHGAHAGLEVGGHSRFLVPRLNYSQGMPLYQ